MLTYAGGSGLNTREDAKQPQPELARIGCLWLMGGQTVPWSVSNRGVHLIDPNLTDAVRNSHAKSGGVYESAYELFRQRVDPATNWLEADNGSNPAKWLAIHDFERWCGCVGDHERYFDSHEMLRAIAGGKGWLVDQMLECAAAYAQTGRQIIYHSGCPDSANFAGDLIRQGRRVELFDSIYATYRPLIERGIGIGMDNAAAQPVESLTYATALGLALAGSFVQVEATPELAKTQWHGWPARIVYEEFVRRHVNQEPWAVGRHAKFGTKEFATLHPDCRVSIFAHHVANAGRINGTDDERVAFLKDAAALVKPIVAGGCRVLLHERIIFEASRLKFSVAEFLP